MRITLSFLFSQSVSAMELVLQTACALRVVSVFAFPTTGATSVTSVRPATMDTRTVPVSGFQLVACDLMGKK